MPRIRVIPCLLLKQGALVKTVQFKNPGYVGDPVNTVRIFNEFEVDELCFLDIAASKENLGPSFAIVEEIASECFMPLTYGGGIRNLDDIGRIFSIGVEKVAINTQAIQNPRLVKEAAAKFGSQSIVASIDVRKGLWGKHKVYSSATQKSVPLDPVQWASEIQDWGAGEILLTSVDRDGTWKGYDLEILRAVTEAVEVPVIACDGAGSVKDMNDAVRVGGASAVAAGSMLVYQKRGMGVLINFPSKEDLVFLQKG